MVSLRYQLNQFKENVRIIINKAYLNNTTVIDISQRLAYKMAAKNGWHRYETKLCHCHPVGDGLDAPLRHSKSTWLSERR